MSIGRIQPPFLRKSENEPHKLKTDLKLLKTTVQVGNSLIAQNPGKAVQQLVVAGIKMAANDIFYNPSVNPLKLVDALKTLGIGALGWAPETLMSAIDKKYGGWTDEQVAEALEHFHKTGTLKTKVPQLVREKLYAIRVIATSNSAQTEWHIFEKIGGVLNDRIAQFGTVEPLSAAECARTVAIIEDIRPDTYENEIKIYIGASCHSDGLYTVAPCKWLAMAEPYLQQMNFEATGDQIDLEVKKTIEDALGHLEKTKHEPHEVDDSLVEIQACRLLAINEYAEEVLKDS